MDSNEKYKSTAAFIDLLFNVLVGFVFLFVIAFLLINPIAKKSNIIVPAEYMVVLTWPDENADDLDIWMRDPNGKLIGYQKKDNGVMHLDRDDLGTANDKIDIDGQSVTIKLNREVVTLRGILPGEYNISIHYYRKHKEDDVPVPVTVEVVKINPYSVVYKQTQDFTAQGQGINYYKFTVRPDGNFENVTSSEENVIPLMSLPSHELTNRPR